jgi:hypothetical protein
VCRVPGTVCRTVSRIQGEEKQTGGLVTAQTHS